MANKIIHALDRALNYAHPDSELWLLVKPTHIGLYCSGIKKEYWIMWVSKTQATSLEQLGVQYK